MALKPEHRQEEWYQQMINAATGKYLPSITSQDAGKVMTVESDGSWGVENPLPEITSADYGKMLIADSDSNEWIAEGLYGYNRRNNIDCEINSQTGEIESQNSISQAQLEKLIIGSGFLQCTITDTDDFTCSVIMELVEADMEHGGFAFFEGKLVTPSNPIERKFSCALINNGGSISPQFTWLVSQIETTYNELVSLRDAGKLVAGATYRMTDYVTKINGKYDLSQFGASGYIHYAKSAEHQFDLILYAIDGSHLSEIVKVAKHEGDTYFEHSAVEAWDVKYTIDNDANKYAWADATNGKGVIYYMKDEFNNEAGYDFKNVMFLAYGLKMLDDNASADYFCRTTSGKRFGSTYGVFSALAGYMSSGEYVNPYAFSSHDFVAGANILGVIQFEDVNDTYLSTFDAEWYYTFDFELTDVGHIDYSLNTVEYPDIYVNCIENKIKICQDALASYLTSAEIPIGLCGTIFENDVDRLCSNNIVETNSFFNIFGGNNNGNVIGISAYSNAIGNDSDYNVIEDGSRDNFLASDCRHNIIGTNSRYVMLYTNCGNNIIGSSADGVVADTQCNNNEIGEYSTDITFEQGCSNNTIGVSCSELLFGYGSTNNIIGDGCHYLSVNTGSNGAHVCDHVRGEYNDHYPIESRTGDCEVWYGYNSSGQIVSWIPADLVPANNN